MTAATPVIEHQQEIGYAALRQLPGPLPALPGWQALIKGLAEGGWQQLEDDVFALVDESIDTASDAFLDQWGALVGEDRGPLGDSDYRRFIRARILANVCTGTTDELLEVLLLASGAQQVTAHPAYPAHIVLTYHRESWLASPIVDRLVRLMRAAKPGGVGLTLVEALIPAMALPGAPVVAAGVLSGPGTGGGLLSRTVYP